MPTDDERRKVAKQIRELAQEHDEISDMELALTLGLGAPFRYSIPRESLLALAEFIEPEPERTCERIKFYDAGGVWYKGCSKCRNPLNVLDSYCSRCGAKVV